MVAIRLQETRPYSQPGQVSDGYFDDPARAQSSWNLQRMAQADEKGSSVYQSWHSHGAGHCE